MSSQSPQLETQQERLWGDSERLYAPTGDCLRLRLPQTGFARRSSVPELMGGSRASRPSDAAGTSNCMADAKEEDSED
ncbi:hypothetical protein DL765_002862 [Monosporascus sp. GIB2]|nr:hypothetical protein DL765_002862 [Monosporascus sp. GIB2]